MEGMGRIFGGMAVFTPIPLSAQGQALRQAQGRMDGIWTEVEGWHT